MRPSEPTDISAQLSGVAIMRGLRIIHHTEKVGEAAERRRVGRVSARGRWPALGTPSAATHRRQRHRVRRRRAIWGQPPSSRATRLDSVKTIAVTHQGCGTPVATAPSRTMSRLQSCVAIDWEILLRPRVGEGRNTMLRRGRCASPVSESVHGRLGSSIVIEEQSEGYHYGGEEPPALRRAV
jgi:hypothetical protein